MFSWMSSSCLVPSDDKMTRLACSARNKYHWFTLLCASFHMKMMRIPREYSIPLKWETDATRSDALHKTKLTSFLGDGEHKHKHKYTAHKTRPTWCDFIKECHSEGSWTSSLMSRCENPLALTLQGLRTKVGTYDCSIHLLETFLFPEVNA